MQIKSTFHVQALDTVALKQKLRYIMCQCVRVNVNVSVSVSVSECVCVRERVCVYLLSQLYTVDSCNIKSIDSVTLFVHKHKQTEICIICVNVRKPNLISWQLIVCCFTPAQIS